ncbi:tumor necrosis factor receptor superfamily member 23-like isoform X3 [Gadus chalcogrammus]|uniref:tumor necrosis factor receptor superfamily member 23-like isoform X3 n=1 Tax=Gadus chalcogrammus TaxID=1042646 RepID=UPI0024C4607D|nr:tumor necrosis factor receptor superfamily member 23-like isoform X3 [Gadus chalcogrammus]
MFLQILFLICSVCNTHGVASTASPSCASDEYRAGQLCCLACPGGYRVHRDCTATTNSLCSKCPDGTFKEGLSGQKQCSACTKCVTGLKVKKRCTPTSDTECEILDGFFCSDSADKDTFSEATLSCQPHTICDSVGGVQIQPGTDSTDSTCITYGAIAFIIIGCICFIISLVLGALFYRWRKMERDLTEWEKLIDEMETREQRSECYALWEQLDKKKKTQKQERKFDELIDQLLKVSVITGLIQNTIICV